MSDAITRKTGADGRTIFGQPMLFECMDVCVLIPAHECEMRGSFAYLLIVKYLSHRFCLNSATEYKTGWPYRGFLFFFNLWTNF